MAKDMARLNEDFIVINIEWCSDKTQETSFLVNTNGYPIMNGDTYQDGYFYRNGKKVLTPLEEQNELNTAYEKGINSI